MAGDTRRCFSCGYDLRGISAGERCPECGCPAVDERDVLDHSAIKDRRSRFAAIACLVGFLFLGTLICTHGFGLLP